MEETKKVIITNTHDNLLNRIRGLHQDAFYLVVSAKREKNGVILEGKPEAFDHLIRDLYDECELAPRSQLKTIYSLIQRIDPEAVEF